MLKQLGMHTSRLVEEDSHFFLRVRLMRTNTIIAAYLVNSRMIDKLEDAELAVELIFQKEFPKACFFNGIRLLKTGRQRILFPTS